ncbi:flavodoxin domain-containing protein [Streptomyces sp. SCSIO 75703]|uniref:flavodoxin domain-containing protein n=1 Tax=unclassified Streptomyces TaxID=2593676 RepID=UPI0004BFAFF5|nr:MULTISPECIES: flavodoxin domain-containing protein [unclassified Streptomyces]
MPDRVLVAYGTTNGSTARIAETVAEVLRDRGLDAEAAPAATVADVTPYRAVVVGGALYTGRWHRDARRFVRRHRRELARRPVWLFSSGPLDSSAGRRDIPPVPGVRRVAARLDAVEHVTFGGCLQEGARGRMARMILEDGRGGDFRDFEAIAGWAAGIADRLVAARRG